MLNWTSNCEFAVSHMSIYWNWAYNVHSPWVFSLVMPMQKKKYWLAQSPLNLLSLSAFNLRFSSQMSYKTSSDAWIATISDAFFEKNYTYLTKLWLLSYVIL